MCFLFIYLFIWLVGWLVFFLANRVKYVMHNYSGIIAKINHLFMIARLYQVSIVLLQYEGECFRILSESRLVTFSAVCFIEMNKFPMQKGG